MPTLTRLGAATYCGRVRRLSLALALVFGLTACVDDAPPIVSTPPAMHKLTVYVDLDAKDMIANPEKALRDALYQSGMQWVAEADRDKADVWVKLGVNVVGGLDNRGVVVTMNTRGKVLAPETVVRCGTGLAIPDAGSTNADWARCTAAKIVNLVATLPALQALAEERHGASAAPREAHANAPPAAVSPPPRTAGPATWPDLATPPATGADGANDAALVVALEDYLFVPKVPGAVRNATDWYTYLVDGRKIPVSQVKLLRNEDATRESILTGAGEVAKRLKPGGTAWVVFIGHGAPSQDGKEGVLVGVDAQQKAESLYARSVRQSELATALGGKPTIMVLDACFSGRAGSGQSIAAGLQPLIVAKPTAGAAMTLLTAGRSDQFAGPLPGANRPAFSYLVLGALRGWGDANGDGVVTAQEAVDYATKALTVLPIGRAQTPELVGSAGSVVLARKATETGPNLSAIVNSR